MTTRFLTFTALALSLHFAEAAPKEPSLISAFAGPHNGTLLLAGIPGSTTGRFTASKKKETGSLILQTSIVSSGTLFSLVEQFTFNKRSATWTLNQTESGSTTTVTGAGTAKISKNKISYTIPVSLGGSSALLFGTMKLAKNNHLTVQETLSAGTGTAFLLYQLNGKKPKK